MGLIVALPLLVRVRREANTSSGNSVGVAKAESPSPTTLKPLPNPPQREGVPPNRLKHSKNGLPPLGEGWGGALGGPGRGFHKQLFFYRRKPDFFYRRRRLFLPWSLLASCTAGRWRWRRCPGGKLVFRQALETSPPRRSRQQCPRLFVFISSPYRGEQIKANSGMPTSSGREAPPQPSPKGGRSTQPPQTLREMGSRPLGGH